MKDRILDLLGDAVAEIFCKMAEEYHITCGDCPPDVEYKLEAKEDDLAEYMKHAFIMMMQIDEEGELA